MHDFLRPLSHYSVLQTFLNPSATLWGPEYLTLILICDPSHDKAGQDFMTATNTSEETKSAKKFSALSFEVKTTPLLM